MRVIASCIMLLVSMLHQAGAATVEYSLTALGADKWRYDYTVTNGLLTGPIQELTIMFPFDAFAHLTVELSPASWDSLAAAPDVQLTAAGFFDSMTLSSGIEAGHRLGGFVVSFDFLLPGIPGAQAYYIVDPASFAVLDSGVSTHIPAVPDISTLAMWWIGALVLGMHKAVRMVSSFRRDGVERRAS